MNKPVNCLIYVTIDNEIMVYYDIKLKSILFHTLIHYMKSFINDFLSLKENQHSLGLFI